MRDAEVQIGRAGPISRFAAPSSSGASSTRSLNISFGYPGRSVVVICVLVEVFPSPGSLTIDRSWQGCSRVVIAGELAAALAAGPRVRP